MRGGHGRKRGDSGQTRLRHAVGWRILSGGLTSKPRPFGAVRIR